MAFAQRNEPKSRPGVLRLDGALQLSGTRLPIQKTIASPEMIPQVHAWRDLVDRTAATMGQARPATMPQRGSESSDKSRRAPSSRSTPSYLRPPREPIFRVTLPMTSGVIQEVRDQECSGSTEPSNISGTRLPIQKKTASPEKPIAGTSFRDPFLGHTGLGPQ